MIKDGRERAYNVKVSKGMNNNRHLPAGVSAYNKAHSHWEMV